MRAARIIVILIVFCSFLVAQDDVQVDSIKKLIPELNSDTSRIRNYLVLAESVIDINDCYTYSQKALNLAEKNLGLLPGEELRALLLQQKAYTLNNLGYYYKEKNDPKKAIVYYEQSKKIFSELGHKGGEATCLTNIVALDVANGNIAEGVSKYNQALKLFMASGDKQNAAVVLNNIGNLYLNQGNIRSAFEYLEQALKIHLETRNVQGEVVVYLNLGSLYYSQKEYQTAFDFYYKAHQIYEKQNDKLSLAKSYSNLGATIKWINRNKSLHYDSLALMLFTELRNEQGIASCYNNLGSTLSELNQLELGLRLVIRAFVIREKLDDLSGLCFSSRNISEMYLYIHKYDSALYWGNKAHTFAKRLGIKQHIRDAAETLSKIYAKLKDFEKAYNYHIEFKALNDTIVNSDSRNLAAQQLARIEFEKKEVQLQAEQEKKDLRAQEEKRKQNLIITWVSVVLALALILVIIVFRSLRINQKKNKIITEQKHLVEDKQKEILDSIRYAKRIQSSLLPTDKYIDRVLAKRGDNNITPRL